MRDNASVVFVFLILIFSGLSTIVNSSPNDSQIGVLKSEDVIFNSEIDDEIDLNSLFNTSTQIPFLTSNDGLVEGLDVYIKNENIHLSYFSGKSLYYGEYDDLYNKWRVLEVDNISEFTNISTNVQITGTEIAVNGAKIHIIWGYKYYNQTISATTTSLRYATNNLVVNQQILENSSNFRYFNETDWPEDLPDWTAFDLSLYTGGLEPGSIGGKASLEYSQGATHIAYDDNRNDCGWYISNIQVTNPNSISSISSIKDDCTQTLGVELFFDYDHIPNFFYSDNEDLYIQVGVNGSRTHVGGGPDGFPADFDYRIYGSDLLMGYVEFDSSMYQFYCCDIFSREGAEEIIDFTEVGGGSLGYCEMENGGNGCESYRSAVSLFFDSDGKQHLLSSERYKNDSMDDFRSQRIHYFKDDSNQWTYDLTNVFGDVIFDEQGYLYVFGNRELMTNSPNYRYNGDNDGDGVDDSRDLCPSTTAGDEVNGVGCADYERDSDDDGISDSEDLCEGYDDSLDSDNDGTPDGCQDSDGDGVTDDIDACPGSFGVVDSIGCASDQRDSDSDGVLDKFDQCEGYDDSLDSDDDGIPDGCDSTDDNQSNNTDNDTSNSACSVSITTTSASRSCSIPNDDMDWDDEPDSSDDDQDGDGRLDVIELTDTVENNDPATVDESVISNPELDSTHSISIIRDESNLEIIVDYEISLPLFTVHVPTVAYFNEDGTAKDPQDYDYTLNSKNELDRLEQHMCDSPNLNGYMYEGQTIPEWLENYSIAGTTHAIDNWNCEWLQRRTIDIMSLMMISDANELDTWRETIRYKITLDFTSNSIQDVSINIPVGEPSNDLQQWVWNLIVEDESASQNIIYHPWAEEANAIISIPASSNQGTGDTNNQGNDIPTRDGQWTIRFELDGPGPVDCGSYGMIYSSKDSYSSSDDIFISCSAEPEEEITFCIKIYNDFGMYEDSSCQTAQYFMLVAASGTDLNGMTWEDELNQDLDDWENDLQQDLDDWESDFDTDYSSGSDSEELFDDSFMLLIAVVLILGGVAEAVKRSKNSDKTKSKKRARSGKRQEETEYDDTNYQVSNYQPEQYNSGTQEIDQYLQEETDYVENYDNQQSTVEDNSQPIKNSQTPSFEYSGEVNEDGWEVCEYPRGSSNWWWKNYPEQRWDKWE